MKRDTTNHLTMKLVDSERHCTICGCWGSACECRTPLTRIQALAHFLNVYPDECCAIADIIEQESEDTFNYEGEQYLVLTEDESFARYNNEESDEWLQEHEQGGYWIYTMDLQKKLKKEKHNETNEI